MQAVARKLVHVFVAATLAGCASMPPKADPGAAYCDALEELMNRCTARFMSSPVARGDQSGCLPISEVLQPEFEAALADSAQNTLRRDQFSMNLERSEDYLRTAFLHQNIVVPDFLIESCRDIASWKQ